MKKLTRKQQKEIGAMEKFLKEAFCVDGESSAAGFIDCEINGKTRKGIAFELDDSIRGKFYVSCMA